MTVGIRNERWKLTTIGAVFGIASALETGLMLVLWFLLGLFPHDVPSGDHREPSSRIKGGS